MDVWIPFVDSLVHKSQNGDPEFQQLVKDLKRELANFKAEFVFFQLYQHPDELDTDDEDIRKQVETKWQAIRRNLAQNLVPLTWKLVSYLSADAFDEQPRAPDAAADETRSCNHRHRANVDWDQFKCFKDFYLTRVKREIEGGLAQPRSSGDQERANQQRDQTRNAFDRGERYPFSSIPALADANNVLDPGLFIGE